MEYLLGCQVYQQDDQYKKYGTQFSFSQDSNLLAYMDYWFPDLLIWAKEDALSPFQFCVTSKIENIIVL